VGINDVAAAAKYKASVIARTITGTCAPCHLKFSWLNLFADAAPPWIHAVLTPIFERLEAIETRFGGIETRLGGIETRLDGIDTRLQNINEHLGRIEARQTDTHRVAVMVSR
jgi:hypothetical protein